MGDDSSLLQCPVTAVACKAYTAATVRCDQNLRFTMHKSLRGGRQPEPMAISLGFISCLLKSRARSGA
jgi:hypothetical protein